MRWYELLPLALAALLIFGPKRLPEMGASIGKTIREFQKSMREVTNAIDTPSLSASQSEPAAPTLPPTQATQPAQLDQPEQPVQPASATTSAQSGPDA